MTTIRQSAMTTPLRLLIVEDSEDDAAVIVRTAQRGGFEPEHLRVETPGAMKAALAERRWDVITCDYVMPHFSGPAALELLRASGLDVPLIVVSGQATEEAMVEMLRAGARDFVVKGNLSRLVPAIERELRETEVRLEHRHTAAVLRETETRFRTMVHVSPSGIFYGDAAGDCIYVSERWCALSGLPAAAARGRGWLAALHAEDRERIAQAWYRSAREKRAFEEQYRLRRPDGSVIWVLGRGETEGGAPGRVGSITDITQLKAREAALERAERIAHVGSWETDLRGNRLVYSDEALRIHGLARGEFDNTLAGAIALAHPDDRLRVTSAINDTLYRGAPFAIDYRIVRPDGGVRHVHAEDEVERDADGTPVRAFGITQDITARKEAEAAQARLAALVAASEDAIYGTDLEGIVTSWNPGAERIFGYTEVEMVGRPVAILAGAGGAAEPLALRARAMRGEAVRGVEGVRYRKDGTAIDVAFTVSPVRGAGGELAAIAVVARDVSERKRAERALQEEQRRLALVTENVPAMIAYVERDYRYAYANLRYRQFYGGSLAPVAGKRMPEVMTPQAWDDARARVERALAGETVGYTAERRLHDGSTRHVSVSLIPHHGEDGAVLGMYVLAVDVTQETLAEHRIRRLNRVQAVLSGINGAIVRIRDRQALFDEACRIAVELGRFRFAWLCTPDAGGERLVTVASAGEGGDFLERIRDRLSLRDDMPGAASTAARERRAIFVNDVESSPLIQYKDLHRSLGVHAVGVLPILLEGKAAAVLGLHATEPGFFDEDEQRLLLELAGDIAFALDHMAKEERVHHLAYYDALTGLANRSRLLERLGEQVAAAAGAGRTLALAIINIERFKTINDTLGREAGDAVLREFAARLSRTAGDPALVARVGGDVFAAIVPEVRDPESLDRLFEASKARVEGEPYLVRGAALRIATRAGVALFPRDAADAETLFRNAEAALKRAQRGRAYAVYTEQMSERAAEKLELENRLRAAIEKREFVLHYQPKFELATRRLSGAEALIRWASPELGLVPPGRFIPLLEETGMILTVGAWAMTQAVADRRRWLELGLPAPRVAVNVSPVEVRQRDFVARLREQLAHGEATGIDLELTESLLMEDIEGTVQKLAALRELGVGVAIDDFGTGYSSLGYLARLPVQALKIDRSFIVRMSEDPNAMTLISTIITLAHALRLKVIAEGVESEQQARMLGLLRCDEIQGYLLGKPVPAAEFEAMLRV
jgi:diguanylate cyclase (GGDEF)-like protein/PAS domain S-box-containing protein